MMGVAARARAPRAPLWEPLQLYGRYAGVSVRAQMQYRLSFVMNALGQFAITGIEFLGVLALFARFGSLDDWTLPEVALFYGVVNVSFSCADGVSGGFDKFSTFVRDGSFDRMLVRPRSPVLQLVGYEITLKRVGRIAQGLLVLFWAAWALDVSWTLGNLALLAFALVGGACLFFGLFVFQATICFFTVEGLELMNTLSYGGVETAQYPLVIYSAWFRRFFTFVVPLAAVAYFPVIAILGREDALGSPLWLQCAAPGAGIAFLALALGAFRLGIRRYTSTGS